MGQKVHPYAFRIGINKTWKSRWFTERNYTKYLMSDIRLRSFLKKKLKPAGVQSVEIQRSANLVHVIVTVARPGIVIGRGGSGIEELSQKISQMTGSKVKVDIKEVDNVDTSAQIVANDIARQIERRINYKRAMKKAIDKAMQSGAMGIKIKVSGRLNGAEIARKEWSKDGAIPLHTLRSDIDYGTSTSHTTYGCIGIKVWVYKGQKNTIIRNR